jgi:predicted Zn-dependent peptidase
MQNALTGFDQTAFELHIPTDNPELMEMALKILRQLSLEVRSLVISRGISFGCDV